MQLATSLDSALVQADTIVAIGTFDGVHRGHRYLLEQVTERARATGRLSAVVTFYPHPRLVLHPAVRPACLSTPAERAARLEALGLDLLVIQPFSRDFAETTADQFVSELVCSLRMRELWVGAGFMLGRGRRGDVAYLTQLGERCGFALRVVEPLLEGGAPISSTRIRALVLEGEVAEAGRLLGHPYTIAGPVVAGHQRGRTLGFRTANLRLTPERAIPANGVYAVRVQLSDKGAGEAKQHDGVANLGVRPSFNESDRLLEVHLLDYRGDLYGENVTVEFVERLRPEQVFAQTDELIAQIGRDIVAARTALHKV
jgi:riboflavin kinase/FMN adenylyltransferase